MSDRLQSRRGIRLHLNGGRIVCGDSARFVPRGINMTHAWGDAERSVETIPHLARTSANCVRAVFGTFPGGIAKSATWRERVARAYLDAGLTPIVEDHDATCKRDAESLRAVVDAWLDPANLRWLDELHDRVVLNIANEWGPANGDGWCAGYIEAVGRLRGAGVRNLILIDAPGCGQEIAPVIESGRDVFLADPLRNTAFSIHLYKRWHTEARESLSSVDALSTLREATDVVRGFGSDLIVGEFSSQEFVEGRYDDARLIDIFDELDLGWLAWSWNQNDKRSLDIATDWKLEDEARDLTAFGRRVVTALRRSEVM